MQPPALTRVLPFFMALSLAVPAAATASAFANEGTYGGSLVVATSASAPGDPTVVHGIEWLEVDSYYWKWVTGPIPTGKAARVALAWRFWNAASGTTWKVEIVGPGGLTLSWNYSYSFDESTRVGCLYETYTDPLVGSVPYSFCAQEARDFSVGNYLKGPCAQPGDWRVVLGGFDPGAYFDGRFTLVLEPTITLDVPGPIAPRIPADSIGGVAVTPGTTRLRAAVEDPLCSGFQVPSEEVSVKLELEPGSGGHSHQIAPAIPSAALAHLIGGGAPSNTSGGGPVTWDAVTATLHGPTGPDNALSADVLGGEASCTLRWTATRVKTGDTATATLVVDPQLGLVPLPANSTLYALTGSRATPPYGPYGANHDENHFVTVEVYFLLRLFADRFRDLTGGVYLLGFDDQSLEHGGIFDMNGDYARPHNLHRRGEDADVVYVVEAATGRALRAQEFIDFVTEAARQAGGRQVLEGGPIHYRF